MSGGQHTEPTLADVRAQFPGWECERALNELFYARQRTTGVWVEGEDPLDLRDQITVVLRRQAYQGAAPGTAGAPTDQAELR